MKFAWDFPYSSRRMPILAQNVVATSQPLAAQAGLRMLIKGGNAVDAAIAAAIALAVVEPTSNGIGSDAFAVVWDGKRLHGLNGSGRSPADWSPRRFAGREHMPLLGWDAVTVPGAVDAWSVLSERFGRLSFPELFKPAIEYARKGFLVSPKTASRWSHASEIYHDFPDFCATFLPNGRAPGPGTLFTCADQAATLTEIAESHGESFYRGSLARRIIDHCRRSGGAMRAEDLATHRSEWIQTISQEYHGVCLHEIPPNGQGLAALIALGILQHTDLRQYAPESADSLHLQIEAMKIAFSEVHQHLSDSDSMTVDAHAFLNADYLSQRAGEIRMDRAGCPAPLPPSGGGTVYLTAADEAGMMVSYIQSNFHGFGSGIVIPQTGIALQNRGYGFSLEKNHPNRVAGAKRPFHTIIPGFVMQKQVPLMSLGVMGAHMQPQGHVQMVVRIVDYDQNPQAASDAPRWYVQEDFKIALEPAFDPAVARQLKRRGHVLIDNPPEWLFGGAQAVYKLENGYCAASDHRKDGQAVGF